MGEELPDWTTTEYLANLAAEELHRALGRVGIRALVTSDTDGTHVDVSFHGLSGAEALMTLAVPQDETRGSLYDRATSSCLTLGDVNQLPFETEEEMVTAVRDAVDAGWVWTIHPSMTGRAAGWHAAVTIPVSDASLVTATLNTLANGGVL